MSEFVEKSFNYTLLEEANLTETTLKEDLGTDLNIVQFLTTAPEGHGGGLAFSFLNLRPHAITQVIVQNITVTENEAVVGGVVSVRRSFSVRCLPFCRWYSDRHGKTLLE